MILSGFQSREWIWI